MNMTVFTDNNLRDDIATEKEVRYLRNLSCDIFKMVEYLFTDF